MNGRGGVFKFFLFLFLFVMVVLQVLAMIQADRLYERLNMLISRWERSGPVARSQPATYQQTQTADPNQPGDEGDWLVWCLDAEPETLNPVTSTSVYAKWIVTGYTGNNICEGLLTSDLDDFKPKPLLAESYEISKDGLEITFRLRADAHFSDGHPVTAHDVVFTYETITNPKVDAAPLANYYRDIDRVVEISEREVKFFMKRVYFLSLDYTRMADSGILPKHIFDFNDPEKFNKRRSNPVGSGPFVFEKWDVGREIVLARNENYWGPKPKLKKIVYRIITNDTAAVQALRSGNVDYIRPLPDQYAELSSDKAFTKDIRPLSYWTPFVGYFWIGWNQDRPFFKDQRVRLAMTHLVDREKICKYLLRNPDAKVPTGPFYIYGRQCDPNIQPWPYDPQRARQLLDEAGWRDTDGDGIRDKDSVPFRFKYMIGSDLVLHEQIAKSVKDEAAKVGIEITLDPYEWSVFIQRVHDRQFDAVSMAWGGGGTEEDPYQIWHSSQIGNRGSNYVGFKNAEADAIIEEARKTLDETARNEMYHRFHRIIHEQQPYTFVYTRPEQRFLDKRFENVIVHKLGLDEREWYVPRDKQKYK